MKYLLIFVASVTFKSVNVQTEVLPNKAACDAAKSYIEERIKYGEVVCLPFDSTTWRKDYELKQNGEAND